MRKRVLVVSAVVLLMVMAFGVGVFAAEKGWLNFTGNVTQSENDVDEIMNVLRQVNEDKITTEEALKELEALNPEGLAKQNKELREEITRLNAERDHLIKELTRANTEVGELNNKTKSAVEEAKSYLE